MNFLLLAFSLFISSLTNTTNTYSEGSDSGSQPVKPTKPKGKGNYNGGDFIIFEDSHP
jgi:hypothetical protein